MGREHDECSACGEAVTTRLDAIYCRPCFEASEARRDLRDAYAIIALLVERLGGETCVTEKDRVDGPTLVSYDDRTTNTLRLESRRAKK